MRIEGEFVRAAHDNEDDVVLGCPFATMSVREERMLHDVGSTVRDRRPLQAEGRRAARMGPTAARDFEVLARAGR